MAPYLLATSASECSGVVRAASCAAARSSHQRCTAQHAAVASTLRRTSPTHCIRRPAVAPESRSLSISATAQPSDRKSTRCRAVAQQKSKATVEVAATASTDAPPSNNRKANAVDVLRRAHAKPAADRPPVAPKAGITLDHESQAEVVEVSHSRADVDYALGLDVGSAPGSVLAVHSSMELERVLEVCSSTLVVLFCKARYCRSCKYFTKKFLRVAESHPGAVFLELVCDESQESFQLMEELQVPSLPHFVMFEEGAEKSRLSSTSEDKLVQAIHEVGH